jgi:F-type H+-transporting ATPase subunit b
MVVRSTAVVATFLVVALVGARAGAFDVAKMGAAKQPPQPAHAAADHGDADHGGHDQRLYGHPQPQESIPLDPYLFFFVLVLFLVLMYLLNRYAWQPILAQLADRDRRVDEAIRQAEIAREEMQRLSLETDKSLAAAHEEIRKTLDQVRADASKDADAMLDRAKDEAVAERTRALAAVEEAKRSAQDSLREASIELAGRMAGKIVDRPLDASAVRKHVTEG